MLRKISLFTLLLTYCAFTHSNDLTAASALSTFTNAKTTSEYRSALQQFQTLYDENPKDADLAFYLGRSLYHQGRFEEADDVLSRNIKRYPKWPKRQWRLGKKL
jgi:tetratricopeptide (TPR) repeat protein